MIEQKRPESSLDRLRWYCTGCSNIVHEAAFHCTDLGTQVKAAITGFNNDETLRKCKSCGTMAHAAPAAERE